MNRPRVAVCLALLVVCAASASERDLYWNELDVVARLDAEGVLHVSERHAMVLTGDWNGGERNFNLPGVQTLNVLRVIRTDSHRGQPRELTRGDLGTVDHWGYTNANTIRWRSRTPEDPPYDHTLLNYVIEYELSNVLEANEGGTYRLVHDFAFRNRPGPILLLRLNLGVDSAWTSLSGAPVAITAGPLQPGEGYVVRALLTGGAVPAPAPPLVVTEAKDPLWKTGAVIALTILIIGVWWRSFLKQEEKNRFTPLPPDTIGWDWLERNRSALLPEVAAAIANNRPSEVGVAAVLARMTAEGKIASWPDEQGVLHLELLRPFTDLEGYERNLVQALFIGMNKTDTNAIRTYYAASGFRPVNVIWSGVNTATDALIREEKRERGAFKLLGVIALGSTLPPLSVAIILNSGRLHPNIASAMGCIVGVAAAVSVVLGTVSAIASARKWRDDVNATAKGAWILLFPSAVAIVVAATAAMVAPFGSPTMLVTAFLCVAALFAAALHLSVGASKSGLHRRLWKRRVTALRDFFDSELRNGTAIEAQYVPYAIALGRGDSVSLGVAESDASVGSWALAAASLAAGVAEPPRPQSSGYNLYSTRSSSGWSSSSSRRSNTSPSSSSRPSSGGGGGSRGGGGSSSSSGGGGGGGW